MTQIGQINSQIAEVQKARDDFKSKALAAKASGDRETALEIMKFIKICDKLLEDIKHGNRVDLSLIRRQDAPVHDQPSHEVAVTQQQLQQQQIDAAAEQSGDARPLTILESLQVIVLP